MSKVLVTIVVCGLISAAFLPTTAKAQVPTGNLLVNPGAETDDLTGWTVAPGGSNPSTDDGSFDPGINPHTGSFDFYGGTGAALGQLTQNVDLTGIAGLTTLVDTGTLQARVGFWEQGLDQGTPSDDGQVMLEFLTGTNVSLGTVTTPTIDSHNGTWQFSNSVFAIPVGTRTIAYTMNFIRNVGTDVDSFIDDNSLIITSGVTPAAPEPASLALLGMPLVGLLVRRSRKQR